VLLAAALRVEVQPGAGFAPSTPATEPARVESRHSVVQPNPDPELSELRALAAKTQSPRTNTSAETSLSGARAPRRVASTDTHAQVQQPRPEPEGSESTLRDPSRAPYFEVDAAPAHAISLALRGSDPLAPRALGLWRLRTAHPPELVSVTASSRAGTFDFGQVLIPIRGAEWAVAPIERSDPESAPARSRLALATPADSNPRAE
jgi:hypothetical protein